MNNVGGPNYLGGQRDQQAGEFPPGRGDEEGDGGGAADDDEEPMEQGDGAGVDAAALGDLVEVAAVGLRDVFTGKGSADEGESDVVEHAGEQDGDQQER